MSENNFTLPAAPQDLCFKAEDFIATDFDVDNFLHEHRKNTTLEAMRDDLGIYLKILRSAMIELINKDYADFVNLSKDLIGLDKVIDQLQAPLGQLREEVMQICEILNNAKMDMSNSLEEHTRIRQLKQCMHSLGRVYKSVSKLKSILQSHSVKLDILERAATEYNQLRFHMTKCKEHISQELNKNCAELEKQLMDSLATQLLCINKSDIESLTCCLRIYVTLDRIDEAENLVRKKIVSPLIDNIITEDSISESFGLRELYSKLLNILDVEMKQLLQVTTQSNATFVRNFNFLVNSFWTEIEEKIELRLKMIFAPGNPDLFYQRYTESLDFITKLQAKCSDTETLLQLKNHPLFIQFLKKWNLPVYFQIRFQEIAGSFEQVLNDPVSPALIKCSATRVDVDKFSLAPTTAMWDCILHTWADGIFLPQLIHQFWKLNFQLFSRYNVWAVSVLTQTWISTPKSTATLTGNIVATESAGPSRIEFLVCLYTDVVRLSEKIPTLLNIATSKLHNHIKSTIPKLLEESLDDVKINLESVLSSITENIVQELLDKSSPNLKQVSDIPRLFRRTMRERPTQPCTYIKNALGILVDFHTTYQKLNPKTVNHWLLLTLTSLTKQYFSSVRDVLESVQKTEESLRRLKKIRDKSSGVSQTEVQGISDDEKIRIQLEIDVLSFADTVKALNIDCTNIKHLDKLIEMVETAVKLKSESK